MRAKEFITETSVTTLTNDVARELPGVYTIGALPNSDFYKQYRFGVAMAGAKGARVRAEQDDKIAPYASATEWGENMVVTDHMDPEVAGDIDYALSELGLKGMQHIMGSKALKVITNSDVPFVVVQKTPMNEHGFKNIVLPIDFNQEVKQGMIYASEMAKYFNSKIHIVYPLEKDEFILAKITRNIPHAEDYLTEQGVDYDINGIEKNNFAKDLITFSQSKNADLITLINNHENIFTYFGGSFEQTVIGNNAEIPVMVINHIALKTAYGFSIYFG